MDDGRARFDEWIPRTGFDLDVRHGADGWRVGGMVRMKMQITVDDLGLCSEGGRVRTKKKNVTSKKFLIGECPALYSAGVRNPKTWRRREWAQKDHASAPLWISEEESEYCLYSSTTGKGKEHDIKQRHACCRTTHLAFWVRQESNRSIGPLPSFRRMDNNGSARRRRVRISATICELILTQVFQQKMAAVSIVWWRSV